MARRVGTALLVAGLLFSCKRGPPPGHITQKNVEKDIRRAERGMAEGRFDDALASVEKAEKNLAKVERLTRKMGLIWRRAKRSRTKLGSLREEIAARKEGAARLAEEEKRRVEEAAANYLTKDEEKPEPEKKEERDGYVDRDLDTTARFAAKKRAVEAPEPEEEEPLEDKSVIPRDLKPGEPVTVVKVEVKGKYLLCYVVFYNPGTSAYLASLSVDFLNKAGKKVTWNRMTYRAEGFKPNWSNLYESKGVGVAANELVVGEKRKVGLVGIGDSGRARDVKKAKVTVMTTDGREYTGKGPK